MKLSDNSGENVEWRAADYGLTNSFARIIRREMPLAGLQKAVERRFKISAAEAKALIHATAGKRTIDRILRNPRHFAFSLEALCDVAGISLEEHIEQQARAALAERATWDAREQHLRAMEARLREGRRGLS